MLVLGRKTQESVVIGTAGSFNEVVRVTVMDVRGGRVKLGFRATDEMAIHREEVWERIRAENGTTNDEVVAQTHQ